MAKMQSLIAEAQDMGFQQHRREDGEAWWVKHTEKNGVLQTVVLYQDGSIRCHYSFGETFVGSLSDAVMDE